jgi:hypothetical protein
MNHEEDLGTLALWDEAPADADAIRVEFRGQIREEIVREGAYLVTWWDIPCDELADPRVLAFRIGGVWRSMVRTPLGWRL